MVKGIDGSNQFVVASLTDSPKGQALTAVSDPSAHHRVVALSLEAKQTEAVGRVMAFALYAMPAIAGLVKVIPCAVNNIWLLQCRLTTCFCPYSALLRCLQVLPHAM